jgi:hypothetical protein
LDISFIFYSQNPEQRTGTKGYLEAFGAAAIPTYAFFILSHGNFILLTNADLISQTFYLWLVMVIALGFREIHNMLTLVQTVEPEAQENLLRTSQ